MSLVHRVIILNKPLKIRGFTAIQWVILFLVGGIGGLAIFNLVPKELKFGNFPANIAAVLLYGTLLMMVVTALEMKPLAWWKNNFLYRLKILPTVYLPHPESAVLYPDSSIIEPGSRKEEFYVQ